MDSLASDFIGILRVSDEGESLTIGRNDDCDLTMSRDVSMSRINSEVQYLGGHFWMYDCHSSFGTLVSAPKRIALKPKIDTIVNVGHSQLKFRLISLKEAAAHTDTYVTIQNIFPELSFDF